MTPPRIFTPEYYARMRALESDSWWNGAMRDVAGRMLGSLALPDRGRMLDVGCGSGQTMSWLLAKLDQWEAIGLDVAPEGLAAAAQLGLDVVRASALDIPLSSASVDLVVTLDVLQHLPLDNGDAAAIDEMRRVLRPGGWLFIRTNAQALPHAPDDPEFQFRKYRPAQLRAKLEAGGFEVLRLSRINALLGLAEIPRELRARREQKSAGYHGILAAASQERGRGGAVKRAWLGVEGRAVSAGLQLPIGRSILALCRVPAAASARQPRQVSKAVSSPRLQS